MEDNVNIPDLSFINACNKKYGINRGVYNTIDAWFYNQGLHQIIKRRQTILSFLEYINKKHMSDNGRCKFGHGGLTVKLEEYYLSNVL